MALDPGPIGQAWSGADGWGPPPGASAGGGGVTGQLLVPVADKVPLGRRAVSSPSPTPQPVRAPEESRSRGGGGGGRKIGAAPP